MTFDWSPYFAGYSMADFVIICFVGAAGFFPVMVVLLAAHWGVDFVGRVVDVVRR